MTPDPHAQTRTAGPSIGESPGSSSATGPIFAGRYKVVRPLGAGGMGSVILARDAQLGRDVAVKVLPGDRAAHPDSVARFRREATALAKLSHPGIVQAFDVGEHEGRPFLVMEYVAGENLSDRLKHSGPLAPSRAADVGHQLAQALAYAHASGLIHRDVKPANVILTADGRAKLLDLGLARFFQDELADAGRTREGVGMGTPDYSAPEQFRDARSAGPRSDVYALGCTLYHLIGGRVPFPGSSLSEKLDAHEKHEPMPLEELAPETPVGLALAVRRMMAKRPADRFASARAAADALAPYVAGGSSTVSVFRETAVWDGSQIRGTPPRRSSPVVPTVLGLVAGLLLALVGVGVAGKAGWVRVGGSDGVAQGLPTDADAPTPGVPAAGPESNPPPSLAAAAEEDPNVLTVSQTELAGRRFRTINEALAAVKPGQTIRVLDDAVYDEPVVINLPERFAGITLESPRRATLRAGGQIVRIIGVPDVTVRGFRLRPGSQPGNWSFGVIVTGRSSGTRLEGLVTQSVPDTRQVGVGIEGVDVRPGEQPIMVERCTFKAPVVGVRISGVHDDYKTAMPVSGVVVRDNVFERPEHGVVALGAVSRVQVVENRISGAARSGIQLENLFPDSTDILVANNTMSDCSLAVRLYDDAAKDEFGQNVALVNNLVLSPSQGLHFGFLDSGGDPTKAKGPGPGAKLADSWAIRNNWFELPDPKATGGLAKAAVPPSKTDVVKDTITGIDRDLKSPTYLRPEADSELATLGAGDVDPRLPRYVGALPPADTEPWDWDRTWRMPADAQLLTVSKDPKEGGEYRTISEALKEAKPWATVRVLDEADYQERVALDDPARQTGVWLDAPRRAVWELGAEASRALTITGVPHVRVSGFQFREAKSPPARRAFVEVTGRTPGLRLTDLDFASVGFAHAVDLLGDCGGTATDPAVVRRCRITTTARTAEDGVVVDARRVGPASHIRIEDNRITGVVRGLLLIGQLEAVHVTGNAVRECSQAGLQIEDLADESRGVLLANNTSIRCGASLRIWDNPPQLEYPPGRVTLTGNLFAQAEWADVAAVGPSGFTPFGPTLLAAWRWKGNYRDLSGAEASWQMTLARGDVPLTRGDPTTGADEWPRLNVPLPPPAGTDPNLPAYVGALPPEGVEPWDWDRTWRWTTARLEPKK